MERKRTHPCVQQIVVKCLLCVRHCATTGDAAGNKSQSRPLGASIWGKDGDKEQTIQGDCQKENRAAENTEVGALASCCNTTKKCNGLNPEEAGFPLTSEFQVCG